MNFRFRSICLYLSFKVQSSSQHEVWKCLSLEGFFTYFSLFYFLCGQQWFFAPIFCSTHLLGNFSRVLEAKPRMFPPPLPPSCNDDHCEISWLRNCSAETTNYQLLELPFHALLSLNLIGSVATINISKLLIFWQLDIPIIF